VPRRTQWRGRGHESTGREARTTVRESWAGRRNSGERFRPRGGDLRRAKALARAGNEPSRARLGSARCGSLCKRAELGSARSFSELDM
jgi:hypothetical protein